METVIIELVNVDSGQVLAVKTMTEEELQRFRLYHSVHLRARSPIEVTVVGKLVFL